MDWQYSQFSDCAVISYDLKDLKSHPLTELIHNVSFALSYMEHDGIMLRGYISIGKLFHSDSECFGQDLIDTITFVVKRIVNLLLA